MYPYDQKIRSPWTVVLLYIFTLGLYRYYWLYSNYTNIYKANGVKRIAWIRTILAIPIPIFYLIFIWGQINDIGEFCIKKRIPFPYRKLIATSFCLAIFFILGSARLYGAILLLYWPLLELPALLYLQSKINLFWKELEPNITVTTHFYIKNISGLLSSSGYNINSHSTKASVLLMAWVIIYYHEKASGVKNFEQNAKHKFNELLHMLSIQSSLNINPNHHEFEDIKMLISNISRELKTYNKNDQEMIVGIFSSCKNLTDKNKQSQAWSHIKSYITSKHAEDTLLSIIEKHEKIR